MSSRPQSPTGPVRRGRRPASGDTAPVGVDSLLAASIEVMAEHGYHGTSVRDIAERARASPAALYHHFSSKHDVLATIMDRGIEELLRRTREVRDAAGASPVAQLRAVVDEHVLFHLEDQRGALLGTSELRGLEEPVRSEHIAKRHQQQRIFDDVVAEGVRQGIFRTAHGPDAARGLVVMCTGVATWFRSGGPLSRTEIAARYQELALDLVGYRNR